MRSVLDLTPAELRDVFVQEGIEAYRADQVLRWLYRRGVRDFARMSDLGRDLQRRLASRWTLAALDTEATLESRDGTRKLLLRAHDGARLESVLIPEGGRRTLCVSSQIGCSLDCAFCATGRLRGGRNLAAREIVDQLLHGAEQSKSAGERPTHVVFMGMGEPLLNLRNLLQALRILTDPGAIGLSPRRITVSTAGVVPRIQELGEALPVRLAVSLHATTDAVRDRLVPLNRRFPIAMLLDACRRYPSTRREPVSIEYTLIRDVNDSRDDARRLVRLLHGMRVKVNLIPMNEHPASEYRRPQAETVAAFAGILDRCGVRATLRRSRGDDIFAACGQLAGLTAPSRATALLEPGR